jgi:hypothetical protein
MIYRSISSDANLKEPIYRWVLITVSLSLYRSKTSAFCPALHGEKGVREWYHAQRQAQCFFLLETRHQCPCWKSTRSVGRITSDRLTSHIQCTPECSLSHSQHNVPMHPAASLRGCPPTPTHLMEVSENRNPEWVVFGPIGSRQMYSVLSSAL